MLIDVGLPAICVILPPASSVLQEDSSDACVNTRGSVRRASGFVLTGKPELIGCWSALADDFRTFLLNPDTFELTLSAV